MTDVIYRYSNFQEKIPPHLWFGIAAIFHYVGPSFAVLLFTAVGVIGVAWFRIASAALIFLSFTRPVQTYKKSNNQSRKLIFGLAVCFVVMNASFYLALEKLPMSLVAAIEFIGTIGVAFYGAWSPRNMAALLLVLTGVALQLDIEWSGQAVGLFWAGLNGLCFVIYIILGHKVAMNDNVAGIKGVGLAMVIACSIFTPFSLSGVWESLVSYKLVLAGVGVGVCSSVIPYICDQFAMKRLQRSDFAFLMALLPAIAAIVGALVLRQIPTFWEMGGIGLVMLGVACHTPLKSNHKIEG